MTNNIYINQEAIDKLTLAAKALQSPAVVEGCRSAIRDELAKWGLDRLKNPWGSGDNLVVIFPCGKNLKVDISTDVPDAYDKIISNKNSVVASTSEITCKFRQVQVLVDYGIDLHIFYNLTCPLPDEDLNTLRSLGKVRMETESYYNTSETIYCPIPGKDDDIPF